MPEIYSDNLTPPLAGSQGVARKRLLELLHSEDSSGVTLVTAPPGYGKTTLLAQHFAASREAGYATAWLTIDESMRDAQSYRNWLWLAFGGCPDGPGGEGSLLGTRTMSDREFLRALVGRIEQFDVPFVLYLDDYHRAESDDVQSLSEALISHLADCAHIVLASRSRPRLKLGKLTAAGAVREINTRHLAFTESEARDFLGERVPGDELQKLVCRMEGWVAGIQLFRFMSEVEWSLQTTDGVESNRRVTINEVSGRRAHIARYLAEQVFESLNAETQDFLVKTSVLDRVSGDLANAVTGRLDGWLTLEWLHDQNLFLFAVDTEHSSYRYHQLFREFLQDRLRRYHPGLAPVLQHKAAAWLAERGFFGEALMHAYATDDHELLGKIASMAGGWRLTLTEGIALWKPLEGIAAGTARLHPSLQLAHVYYLLQTGRVSLGRKTFELLRQDLRDGRVTAADVYHGFDLDCELLDLLIAVLEDEPWPADRVATLERRLQEEIGLDPKLAMVAHELLGWICYWSGDFEKGVAVSELCLQRCPATEGHLIQTYAYLARAANGLALARLDLAESAFLEAKALAGRILGPGCDQALASDALRSEVSLERGFFSDAEQQVDPLLDIIGTTELWLDLACTAYRVKARCGLEREGIDAALQVLIAGRSVFRDRSLPRFQGVIDLFEIRLLLLAGRLAEAQERAGAFDLDRKAADLAYLQEKGWRIAIPLLTEMARLALECRDVEMAWHSLARLEDWVGSVAANFHRMELKLLQARAHEMDGARSDARNHIADCLSISVETGQLLSFFDNKAWVKPLLEDRALRHQLSGKQALQERQHAILARIESMDGGQTVCPRDDTPGLSPREKQVFYLLCDGLTSKEIARSLGISVNTAMGYRKSVYRKLGASSRSEIVAIARSASVS
jgi:LuxR family maltose regulon positive regulatory protein